ncbi:hypothetical protein ABZ929_06375 [Streptomyces physcomitrii]|uniref:hypothetical protein n=1 Tax=Streptomyces physcomitrii TaxID=2724184 RepID=UPI0033F056FF
MKKRTTGGALAAALAALLLTACGGSDDKDSDEIEGAGKESPSTSAEASPSGSAEAGAPEFDFPSDVTVTVAAKPTGDKVKDAVVRDAGYANQAIKLALAKGDPELPVFQDYVIGQASSDWRQSVADFKKKGHTVTGKVEFYDFKVTGVKGERATVTYCEDQSHAYRKEIATKKVLKTEVTKNSYTGHADTLQKGPEGNWRLIDQFYEEGAATCQR